MKALLSATILSIILIVNPVQIFSQEKTSTYKLAVSGYVRADAIFDSRQVVEAREGFLLFYPKRPVFDKIGKDINAQPSFNQYAMISRVTLKATGPDVLGAKVQGLIEADFTGASNSENNSLRLRHAYISLQWTKTRLLAGQYWHPMDVPEMIPNVLALNTGAPFRSFSRQPQVRLDRTAGNFNFVVAATAQRDYVNAGPEGSTSIYLRNSAIPNFVAQIHYKNKNWFTGIATDYKQLTPRLSTDSLYVANEKLNGSSFSGFISFKTPDFSIKAQYIYGKALNDHLMMGGFGVSGINPVSGQRDYTPLVIHSWWLNASKTYGNWQPSVFLGLTTNNGATEEIQGPMYARGEDIAYVYRVAPMLTYAIDRFSLMAEVEYSVAAYGVPDTKYKIQQAKEIANIRVGLAVMYTF
jgi:hypothetical protein